MAAGDRLQDINIFSSRGYGYRGCERICYLQYAAKPVDIVHRRTGYGACRALLELSDSNNYSRYITWQGQMDASWHNFMDFAGAGPYPGIRSGCNNDCWVVYCNGRAKTCSAEPERMGFQPFPDHSGSVVCLRVGGFVVLHTKGAPGDTPYADTGQHVIQLYTKLDAGQGCINSPHPMGIVPAHIYF